MTSTRRWVAPSPERVFWAGSLVVLAVTGMLTSARAADEAVLSGAVAPGCDASGVRWAYEVELRPGTASYVVAGTRFDVVPPGCAGAQAEIVYRDDDRVLHRSRVVLSPGVVDQLDPQVWTAHSLTAVSWGIVAGT